MNALIVLQNAPCSDAYRCAVETILRDLIRATGDQLTDIAENIDCAANTLYNAFHKKSDLGGVFLARLGAFYGGAYLNPYLALFHSQAQPLPPKPTSDILPVLTTLTHDIAFARSPESPGGATEVPQERKGYLHKAKTLQREIGCLIREVENV